MCHLLDFGSYCDALQVLLEHQDFGVFLLQDGDQVVQESDVSANTEALSERVHLPELTIMDLTPLFLRSLGVGLTNYSYLSILDLVSAILLSEDTLKPYAFPL